QRVRLPRRERLDLRCVRLCGCRWRGQSFDGLGGNLAGERGLAPPPTFQHLEQLLGLKVLEQVALCPAFNHLEDGLVVVHDGEGDDLHLRQFLLDLPGRLDAVAVRHLDIHQDDIGLTLPRQGEGLIAIGCAGNNLQIGARVEQRFQSLAKQGVIVNQHDTQRFHYLHLVPAREIPTMTRVPLPGSESISSVPPRLSARSRMICSPMPPPPRSRRASSPESNPRPSSTTVMQYWSSQRSIRTRTLLARACLRTLASAS